MGNTVSKEEKETILLTSEADDTWQVYTFNAALKKRLKRYAARYPDLCRLVKEDRRYGSETYRIRKSRLSLQLVAPYSEERIRAASEQAREQGIRNLLPEEDNEPEMRKEKR